MAATATKDKAAKAKEKDKAAKAKEKDARAKEREKAARAKEKAAKAKEKEKAAKAKEREKAAKAKEKERAAKAKEKEKAAKAKEKERAAKAKEKDRAAKEKEKAAKAKAKAKDRAAKAEDARADDGATSSPETAAAPAPEQTDAPAEQDTAPRVAEQDAVQQDALPELDVPANDRTIRPKGYLAEALGKEDAVERATQRATLAASYLTRDHDLIRAWAQTRGGRPADVAGTGRGGGAGVLRIEFPDGPGDDSRLEDIDWAPFFQTFDDSDVDFLYQERVRTGDVSRFHKIVRADA